MKATTKGLCKCDFKEGLLDDNNHFCLFWAIFSQKINLCLPRGEDIMVSH